LAFPAANFVNSDFINLLKVLIYLIGGFVGILLLAGWALKRFGPPKK
jgi:hypothetical protein